MDRSRFAYSGEPALQGLHAGAALAGGTVTYHLRKDTLAGVKLSALFDKRDLSDVPLPKAISALNAYMGKSPSMVKTCAEALKFYYANHVFSLIASRYDAHEP